MNQLNVKKIKLEAKKTERVESVGVESVERVLKKLENKISLLIL